MDSFNLQSVLCLVTSSSGFCLCLMEGGTVTQYTTVLTEGHGGSAKLNTPFLGDMKQLHERYVSNHTLKPTQVTVGVSRGVHTAIKLKIKQ